MCYEEEEERIYAMRKKRSGCVLLGRGGEDMCSEEEVEMMCAMRKRRRGYVLSVIYLVMLQDYIKLNNV